MGNVDPPAIRWISEGEHAGFYIFAPALAGKWCTVDPVYGGTDIVREVPPGSEGLYCRADVGHAIDQYRDSRSAFAEHIREDGDDYDPHALAKTEVLTDLADAEEYAVVRAGELFEVAQRARTAPEP